MGNVEGLPNEELRKIIADGEISEYYLADMLGLSFEGFKDLMSQPLKPEDHEQIIAILRQAKIKNEHRAE